MKNLAHSASFHACENNAPSNPGTKQVGCEETGAWPAFQSNPSTTSRFLSVFDWNTRSVTFAEEMRVQRALVCVTDHLSRRNRHVLAVSLKPRMTDILAIQIESGLL